MPAIERLRAILVAVGRWYTNEHRFDFQPQGLDRAWPSRSGSRIGCRPGSTLWASSLHQSYRIVLRKVTLPVAGLDTRVGSLQARL